jgi:O-antigen/teichoic acid export membrane protein
VLKRLKIMARIIIRDLYLTILKNIKILFFKPADGSTHEARSHERYRRAAWTTAVMMTARISNIITGILSVPITLNYLGEDLYGIWMALTGFIGFLSFYDFGIGIGLRNMLIECVAKDNTQLPKKLIGNALLVLFCLAGVMIVVAFIVLPYLPWDVLIKCKDPNSFQHILPAAQAVLVVFAFGLPISQLEKIANAYQRGYLGYLCFLVGRIFSFFFIIWCARTNQPLWLLAGGYVGVPFLVMLLGWVIFFIAVPALRPWPVRPERPLLRQLFGVGFYVFIHHISYAMINTSGLILIVNTINAASAVSYSVTQQMLGVSSVIVGAMLVGISVAVGEAWYRKEYNWIKSAVLKMERIVIIFGIVPIIILLFIGQVIILWWTKSIAAVPTFPLLVSCVLVASLSMIGDIYSNLLSAMNFVRFIAKIKFIAGILVVLGGYIVGTITKSAAHIIFIQFFIGALIPAILFRCKMKQLLSR